MTIPVHADPDWKRSAAKEEIAQLAEESGCPPEDDPAAAGWDIDYWCRLTYGRNPDGDLTVSVNTKSELLQRTVTPAQLADHARHLLQLAMDEVRRGGATGNYNDVSISLRWGVAGDRRTFPLDDEAEARSVADMSGGQLIKRVEITWGGSSPVADDWTLVGGAA